MSSDSVARSERSGVNRINNAVVDAVAEQVALLGVPEGVEREGADFRDVRAQGAVGPRALYAEDTEQIDGNPVDGAVSAAVAAAEVGGVDCLDTLQQYTVAAVQRQALGVVGVDGGAAADGRGRRRARERRQRRKQREVRQPFEGAGLRSAAVVERALRVRHCLVCWLCRCRCRCV